MYRVTDKNWRKLVPNRHFQHISQPKLQVNGALKTIAVCAGLLIVAGCTVSKKPTPSDVADPIITSSISKPVNADGIASQDTEIIKNVVVDAKGTKLLAWQNPETGNKGTITAIDEFVSDEGRQCKKFQTTVDTFMGISLYNGETCELRQGIWVLSQFFRQMT